MNEAFKAPSAAPGRHSFTGHSRVTRLSADSLASWYRIARLPARTAMNQKSSPPHPAEATDAEKEGSTITASDFLAAQVQAGIRRQVRSQLRIADVMQTSPATAEPDDDLLTARSRMRQLGAHHLPVVDRQGRVVGMLSTMHIQAAVDRAGAGAELRVADAMSRTVLTVSPERAVVEAAREFASASVCAIAVTRADGQFLGLVTYIGLLRALAHPAG
jgi:CBS-domain-containing membrane protein